MTTRYPRRLYFGGIPDHADEMAERSVVVESESEEKSANADGYLAFDVVAWKSNGGSSGSPGPALSPPQGKVGAASDSADPLPELRARAKALGLNLHHKTGEAKLRQAIAEVVQ